MKIDYINKVIREESIVSGAYDDEIILGAETSHPTKCEEYNQMVVNVEFTIGNLTNAQVKIEFSPDGATWFRETAASIDGLVSTDEPIVHRLERSANFAIPVQITTRFIRITIIGNGDTTGSLMAINVDLGVN